MRVAAGDELERLADVLPAHQFAAQLLPEAQGLQYLTGSRPVWCKPRIGDGQVIEGPGQQDPACRIDEPLPGTPQNELAHREGEPGAGHDALLTFKPQWAVDVGRNRALIDKRARAIEPAVAAVN